MVVLGVFILIGGPCTLGSLDIAHPVHPLATPLYLRDDCQNVPLVLISMLLKNNVSAIAHGVYYEIS